VHIQHVGT